MGIFSRRNSSLHIKMCHPLPLLRLRFSFHVNNFTESPKVQKSFNGFFLSFLQFLILQSFGNERKNDRTNERPDHNLNESALLGHTIIKP